MNVQRRQDEYRILDSLLRENGLELEELCKRTGMNFHHVQRILSDFRSVGFNINIKRGAVFLEEIPELSRLHYINEILESKGKKTKIFGKNTMVFDTLPSTNDFTYRLGFNEPCEGTVVVAAEQISGKGVKIFPGCRLYGEKTVISEGVRIGYEGPVTIQDCQIGPRVQLKGGYYSNAVFLEESSMGSGAHVREGSILEEQASGAHCVGLKQTILFPFVSSA